MSDYRIHTTDTAPEAAKPSLEQLHKSIGMSVQHKVQGGGRDERSARREVWKELSRAASRRPLPMSNGWSKPGRARSGVDYAR